MSAPHRGTKRARSPSDEPEEDRPQKRIKKAKFVIAPHAPECHKIAIRQKLRQRKAIKKRLIPSVWEKKDSRRLNEMLSVLRDAAEEETTLSSQQLGHLFELYTALEKSKPADLPDVGDRLQTLVEILSHPTWIQNPSIVPEKQAHAMSKLFDGIFRAQSLMDDKFWARNMKVAAFQIKALQIPFPKQYEAALRTMAGMVMGWDRKGQTIKIDSSILLRVCESAAQPPFCKMLPRTRSEVSAAHDFLHAILRSNTGNCLSGKDQAQLRQYIKEVEAEMAKFGPEKQGGKMKKLRGHSLYRISKVEMKPIKPGRRRLPMAVKVGRRVVVARPGAKKRSTKPKMRTLSRITPDERKEKGSAGAAAQKSKKSKNTPAGRPAGGAAKVRKTKA